MNSAPLEILLERLASGDSEAAGRVFLAYEPYLRMVVRRQLSPGLRAKFDSVDIVQSIWADVLKGFREAGWRFASVNHLRAFLVQLTRNRFIDRLRQYRLAVERERPLLESEWSESLVTKEARPSELAQAAELWQEMLKLCPPEHREVLRLKREGAASPEIAAQTGLHEGSVRRILCTLARRLARRHGESDPEERSLP